MEIKTTEEFQQEILKTIKLKNTSVNIYLQQNVHCNILCMILVPWISLKSVPSLSNWLSVPNNISLNAQ